MIKELEPLAPRHMLKSFWILYQSALPSLENTTIPIKIKSWVHVIKFKIYTSPKKELFVTSKKD
jgi:hypothetical protein